MEEDALKGVAMQWLNNQAAKFPDQKIPAAEVAKLADEFGRLMDISRDEAVAFVQESGVLAKQSSPVEQPADKEGEVPTMSTESISDVIRANMDKMRQEIEAILTKKKIAFGKNSVYSIMSQLRKKQKAAIAETNRRPANQPADSRAKVSAPAPAVKTPKVGKGALSQIDLTIKEVINQIARLEEDLGVLKQAREILQR